MSVMMTLIFTKTLKTPEFAFFRAKFLHKCLYTRGLFKTNDTHVIMSPR